MELIQALDVGAWNWLQDHKGPLRDHVLVAVTNLGNQWVGLAVVLVAVAYLGMVRRQTTPAMLLIVALLGGLLIIGWVPTWVGRDRPQVLIWPRGMTNFHQAASPWAYPSQYTLLATVIYLPLAMIAGDLWPRYRRGWRTAAAVLIVLVGSSRLYIGRCYVSDVLGAWMAGSGWVLICRGVQQVLAPSDGIAAPAAVPRMTG